MPDGFDQSVRSDDRIDVQTLGFGPLLRRRSAASALVEVQDRGAMVVVELPTEGQKVLYGSRAYPALLHSDSGVLA